MATKKSKVFKKASKNKLKIPRWGIVVVIGLVAAIGIFAIWRSFAATGLIANVKTKVLTNAGDRRQISNRIIAEKSPITVEACRMSDTPGDGPENRVYFGAKPVVTKELADRLNKVWDNHFPEYHIEGQDVPWAADYAKPYGVGLFASYLVNDKDRTNTTEEYGSLIKPSEAFKKVPQGGWWDYKEMPQPNYLPQILQRLAIVSNFAPNAPKPYPYNIYPTTTDPNITGRWTWAQFLAAPIVSYQDMPYDGANLAAYNNNLTKNVGRQNQTQDNIDKSKVVPFEFIKPGELPGRPTWSYLQSRVMKFNKDKCDNVGDPNCYDIINNPNPLVYLEVSWNKGMPNEEHIRKAVRFKELPKCGQSPIRNTQAQIDEYNKFKAVRDKMPQLSIGNGGTPESWKATDTLVNAGVSPLTWSQYWMPGLAKDPSYLLPVKQNDY